MWAGNGTNGRARMSACLYRARTAQSILDLAPLGQLTVANGRRRRYSLGAGAGRLARGLQEVLGLVAARLAVAQLRRLQSSVVKVSNCSIFDV